MRKTLKNNLQEHIVALSMALVVVGVLFLSINKSGRLTADLLQQSGDGRTFAMGDIGYSTDTDAMHVRSLATFSDVQSLTFLLIYNPATVKINLRDIKTSYDYTSSLGKDGQMHVTLFASGTIEESQELFIIPITGIKEDVTISDATVLFAEGNIDGLTIKKQ